MKHSKRVRGYLTEDGTLPAKKVVERLQDRSIDNKTISLSWTSWCFDVFYLRAWLEGEELKEFRSNVKRAIGTTCFRGRLPLSLPVVFLFLFGETHSLAGRNHNALVDAKQLALMAKIFVDLCKTPGKRVHWGGTEVKGLGSGKRQRALEDYVSPARAKNKPGFRETLSNAIAWSPAHLITHLLRSSNDSPSFRKCILLVSEHKLLTMSTVLQVLQ